MTREEAIVILKNISWQMGSVEREQNIEAINIAIEALQFVEYFDLLKEFQLLQEVVQCKDCEYQNECEEVILFDINDDEVIGHRVHWCSYRGNKK